MPALAGLVMRCVAAAMPSKAVDTAGSSSAPCGVSFTRWPARSNSLTPSDCSSALIWWLMAPWVTFSSAAALVSEAWRAVASKARSGLRGADAWPWSQSGQIVLDCEIFSQQTP